jgi:uncharacterized membrane protein YqjE
VFSSNKLRQRVSVAHKHHNFLIVQIARHNDRTFYIVLLAAFTAVFMYFSYVLISPLFRRPFSRDAIYLVLLIAFIVVWYIMGLRLAVWRTFGVEHITVEDGVLHWKRTALCWVRELVIPTKNIVALAAVSPWHSLSNHVEFTALGKRRKIGDMLLRVESCELAELLRRAVGVSR